MNEQEKHIFTAIKYPEHDLNSRRIIWRKFFELASVKTEDTQGSGRSTPTDMVKLDDPTTVATISDAELDELAEKPFNGRTIKNLVRTAQALALSSLVDSVSNHINAYPAHPTAASPCPRRTSMLW
jgi:hypothetical protein